MAFSYYNGSNAVSPQWLGAFAVHGMALGRNPRGESGTTVYRRDISLTQRQSQRSSNGTAVQIAPLFKSQLSSTRHRSSKSDFLAAAQGRKEDLCLAGNIARDRQRPKSRHQRRGRPGRHCRQVCNRCSLERVKFSGRAQNLPAGPFSGYAGTMS